MPWRPAPGSSSRPTGRSRARSSAWRSVSIAICSWSARAADGPEGRVRIGNRTRQLLSHSRCALAVAPRGLGEQPARRLARIGVGYDGAPESEAALALAGALAVSTGATLRVRAVVDDRVPMVGWQSAMREQVLAMWDELLAPQIAALLERAQSASEATGAELERGGRPARPPGRRADGAVRAGRPAGDRFAALGRRRAGSPRPHRRSAHARRERSRPGRAATRGVRSHGQTHSIADAWHGWDRSLLAATASANTSVPNSPVTKSLPGVPCSVTATFTLSPGQGP